MSGGLTYMDAIAQIEQLAELSMGIGTEMREFLPGGTYPSHPEFYRLLVKRMELLEDAQVRTVKLVRELVNEIQKDKFVWGGGQGLMHEPLR